MNAGVRTMMVGERPSYTPSIDKVVSVFEPQEQSINNNDVSIEECMQICNLILNYKADLLALPIINIIDEYAIGEEDVDVDIVFDYLSNIFYTSNKIGKGVIYKSEIGIIQGTALLHNDVLEYIDISTLPIEEVTLKQFSDILITILEYYIKNYYEIVNLKDKRNELVTSQYIIQQHEEQNSLDTYNKIIKEISINNIHLVNGMSIDIVGNILYLVGRNTKVLITPFTLHKISKLFI